MANHGYFAGRIFARPPPLPIFSARRRPFEHRDKKGPAECRAFAS